MNRNELIIDIANRTEQAKKDVTVFMDAYEAAIIVALSRGDSVLLHKFMRIERKVKKEYKSHGFGTGDSKIVPEHEYVKIRPGSSLADCVKEGQG